MKEFAAALLHMLHENQIAYAIGGSVASSYYGEPRLTQDIDLSISLDEGAVETLVAACEALGWHITRESAQEAVRSGGTFSTNDGFWKADFFVVRNDAFAVEAFGRRQQGLYALADQQAWFLSPEDIILHKLRWMQGAPLDKHMRDIIAILHVWYDKLDLAYMARWVEQFGAGGLWSGILDIFRHTHDD